MELDPTFFGLSAIPNVFFRKFGESFFQGSDCIG